MSASITLPRGAQLCHLPSPFALARGGELHGAVLAYERQGRRGAPVVLVLGGISAGRHVGTQASASVPGWWPQHVGRERVLDTARFDVLAFDWIGGRGASTTAGEQPLPFVAAEDQARALWCLCDDLGIDNLFAIVGCSYGGMVALHAAAQAPERVRRLAVLAAAHRSHAQASAWRAVQRAIVELGQRAGCAPEALAIARALAMTTYRSPEELHDRFAAAPQYEHGRLRTAVQPWLEARGETFAREWRADAFLTLNRSIDAHTIDPARVTVPTWLLAFASDQLVPPSQVRELAQSLPGLRGHHEVASRFGHDGFLKETAAVDRFLAEVLS